MATPETYEAYAFRRLPRWLRGTTIDKLWTSVFGMLDVAKGGADQAMKAHFVESCPVDAVPAHGRECKIDPLPGESTEAYRLRLIGKWDFKTSLGPKVGLQAAMRLYTGLSGLFLYDIINNDWLTGALGGEDNNPENWSRMVCVIQQPHPWEVPVFGPGHVFGSSELIGVDMSLSELSLIRRRFQEDRPAHVVGIDVYVIFDSDTADNIRNDRTSTLDWIRVPLGPYGMIGYPHHAQVLGAGSVIGRRFT